MLRQATLKQGAKIGNFFMCLSCLCAHWLVYAGNCICVVGVVVLED